MRFKFLSFDRYGDRATFHLVDREQRLHVLLASDGDVHVCADADRVEDCAVSAVYYTPTRRHPVGVHVEVTHRVHVTAKHPMMFYRTLQQLGASARQCWSVATTLRGLYLAEAAASGRRPESDPSLEAVAPKGQRDDDAELPTGGDS